MSPSFGQTSPCQPRQPAREGWSASFIAGCTDGNGVYAGGSQVMHLIAHKGQLYAANGYWMDRHSIWYGGKDARFGWGQVLRLTRPDQPWTVDLQLGPRHLRTELLKSVTFTLDVQGHRLAQPDTLLIAATYDGSGKFGVNAFIRDDQTGAWTRSPIVKGDTGRSGEDNSVRAAAVFRDRVTGQEHLFVSVGVVGIFTGQYDPSAPGRIVWSAKPEFGPTSGTRILSIVEANGSLFFSEGTKIFRRIDGPAPRYEPVADFSDQADPNTGRKQFSGIGGIRALSPIPGPVAGRQSLLFMWNPGKTSKGCVYRLDPRPDGTYAQVLETCLATLAGQYIGTPVPYTAGAYNSFMPLLDDRTGDVSYLIGLESFIPVSPRGLPFQPLTAHNQRNGNGGMYAGGMFALRDSHGLWRVGEVNGRFAPGQPELVSVYTYAMSPFGGADSQTIYFGGYDPDEFASTDTAWIYSTGVATLFAR
jgi:poly(A) polymerase